MCVKHSFIYLFVAGIFDILESVESERLPPKKKCSNNERIIFKGNSVIDLITVGNVWKEEKNRPSCVCQLSSDELCVYPFHYFPLCIILPVYNHGGRYELLIS